MPLTVCSLLEHKSVTLAVCNQSAAFGMGDTNYPIGHASSLDILPKNAPNLIYLLAQIWHVRNRNIRLAIQDKRILAIGKVHRNNAGNLNLLTRWQRGKWRRRLAGTSTAQQADKK